VVPTRRRKPSSISAALLDACYGHERWAGPRSDAWLREGRRSRETSVCLARLVTQGASVHYHPGQSTGAPPVPNSRRQAPCWPTRPRAAGGPPCELADQRRGRGYRPRRRLALGGLRQAPRGLGAGLAFRQHRRALAREQGFGHTRRGGRRPENWRPAVRLGLRRSTPALQFPCRP
jgi:hypothetical protein